MVDRRPQHRFAALALPTFVMLIAPIPASGHGGGLNAQGCHNDRKNGGYHCHRDGTAASRPSVSATRSSATQGFIGGRSTYYPNCAAARAASAAPIREGQPRYSRRLDRDGDGVACE